MFTFCDKKTFFTPQHTPFCSLNFFGEFFFAPRPTTGPMSYYTTSRLSERLEMTPEGYLLCKAVPIARTGALEYLPEEVPPDKPKLKLGEAATSRAEAMAPPTAGSSLFFVKTGGYLLSQSRLPLLLPSWWRLGRYKKISTSFYTPNSPANLTQTRPDRTPCFPRYVRASFAPPEYFLR